MSVARRVPARATTKVVASGSYTVTPSSGRGGCGGPLDPVEQDRDLRSQASSRILQLDAEHELDPLEPVLDGRVVQEHLLGGLAQRHGREVALQQIQVADRCTRGLEGCYADDVAVAG